MKHPYRYFGAVLFLALACSPAENGIVEEEGPLDLRVSLDPPEFGYQLATESYVVEPHSEVYKCSVVRIDPTDGENLAWIGALASRTSEASHHMNVNMGIFSMGDALLGEGQSANLLGAETGTHDCADLGDLMQTQQVQTVYPSQRTEQEGVLPEGVALPLPVPLVLIMEHHYINTRDEEVKVNAVLNLERTHEDEVEYVTTGVWGGIDDVELPPHSRKIETGTCRLTRDFTMFAISSHSHERGACFSMNFYSDHATPAVDPEPFFINDDWESPPILFMEQQSWTHFEPLQMREGDGIHWACHYVNPEDRTVTTGPTADDEMCIFVAMGYPGDVSVEEVKEMFASDSLSLDDALRALTATVPCEPVEDVESPWEEADIAFDLDEGDAYAACAGYETTLE